MSTQIMPAYFTTTRVRKVSTGKPQTAAQKKHAAFIASMTKGRVKDKNLLEKQFKDQYRENMVIDTSNYNSAGMSGSVNACAKTDIMTKMFNEKPEVQKQILAKAARTAPLYSKGPYQYIGGGQDLTDLGRKK